MPGSKNALSQTAGLPSRSRCECTKPPEPITETFIEIIDAGTGQRVVTVIEFLSLSKKVLRRGPRSIPA